MERKEQIFIMFYDNRRKFVEPEWFKNAPTYHNLSNMLLDTEPLNDILHCKTVRFINKYPLTVPYNKHNANKSLSKYTNTLDIAIKQFIKAYYTQSFGLNNNNDEFKFTKDLISFIYGISPTKEFKLSVLRTQS
jgi:hypothetical protein